MPKLVVGFSQKVGEPNYSSRGGNVTLELEVDSPTNFNPDLVRSQLQGLFRLARQAVEDELSRPSRHAGESAPAASANGHPPALPPRHVPRLATPNQVRAIVGLAMRHHVNLMEFLQVRFRLGRVEDLSLSEASAVIDELKNWSATLAES